MFSFHFGVQFLFGFGLGPLLFGWTPVQDYPFGLQYPQQEFLLKAPGRGGFCHV